MGRWGGENKNIIIIKIINSIFNLTYFDTYLLSTYYLLGIILRTEDRGIDKITVLDCVKSAAAWGRR